MAVRPALAVQSASSLHAYSTVTPRRSGPGLRAPPHRLAAAPRARRHAEGVGERVIFAIYRSVVLWSVQDEHRRRPLHGKRGHLAG